MRKLFSLLVLTLAAAPVFAIPTQPPTTVPEPETLALVALGAMAAFVSRRKNK